MAAENPYEVLGVKPDATAEQIRSAYRKLAKRYHPDLNPGKPEAEQRFKAVASANDILSDPEKRARFDRGEIDASGAERPERAYYRQHAEGGRGAKYRGGTAGGGGPDMTEEDLEDLFSFFGSGARRGPGGQFQMRGADRSYSLTVPFIDAVNGTRTRIQLAPGQSLDVTIPAGVRDGQVLRLKGKGSPGVGGGPPGDALIEVQVAPHAFFRRDGDDIRLDLPVTLAEAVLGGRINVPTTGGNVAMTVPPGSNSGTVLRLRGKGVVRAGGGHGDQYVTLKVVLPPDGDGALAKFLKEWAPSHSYDPRKDMGAP